MIQFEYLNPLAGLAMLVIGLFLTLVGYSHYGITPIIVGLVLVFYYGKYLIKLMAAF